MRIVLHNLKVAFRNLMKYKLQTLISVLSIVIVGGYDSLDNSTEIIIQ